MRISSNPSFSEDPVRPSPAIENSLIVGHRQVTDAYLIALADSKHGRFATLDRAAKAARTPDLVELLRDSSG